MRTVPTNSFYTNVRDIIKCVPKTNSDDIAAFERSFARYLGVKHAFLVGSGTSALFLILSALKKLSKKTEVVLPAYTVPTLTLAINRAGLVTRLAEIDPETLNLDPTLLGQYVTKKTLAVVPVHMFGFPMDLGPIREAAKREGFFVVEDAAQAPGAVLDGKRTGCLGDAALFSLCKGKIISTFRGGVITTDREDIATAINQEMTQLTSAGTIFDIRILVTLILMSLVIRPGIYGPLLPLVSLFKSTTVHTHFDPAPADAFVARLGERQLAVMDDQVQKRMKNGMTLMAGLAGVDAIAVPRVIRNGKPSFNQMPILVKDEAAIEPLRAKLLARGIDTARMYERPIHHVYDLGYPIAPDPFEKATFVAEHLMVLPTHPLVSKEDIRVMIETIRETE